MQDKSQSTQASSSGRLHRWWTWFRSPTSTFALGTLLVGGVAAGIVFWGGFNWAMELTNTESFCISCHEMKANVYSESRTKIHHANRSGVRASCPDCHVPKEWAHKIVRKIRASNELYHHLLGTIDTPEKFNNKRIELAKNEWRRMKSSDSRECRNCHKFDYMDYSAQEPRASRTHQEALSGGKTCIDCHRGIAHTLPPNANEAYQQLVNEMKTSATTGIVEYLRSVAPAANAAASPAGE